MYIFLITFYVRINIVEHFWSSGATGAIILTLVQLFDDTNFIPMNFQIKVKKSAPVAPLLQRSLPSHYTNYIYNILLYII